ncbi:MAG: hypothetical protein KA807_02335 [Prolixibacteraceae bacterium]|nr:hypothetical protein [Prolixibacteraceae bacterium]
MKTQTLNFGKIALLVLPFTLMSFTSPKENTEKCKYGKHNIEALREVKSDCSEKETLKIEKWMTDEEYWKYSKKTQKENPDPDLKEKELSIEKWMLDDSLWAGK